MDQKTKRNFEPHAIGVLLLALSLLIAWLNPNHYVPWLAFHADWVSGLGLIICWVLTLSAKSVTVRMPPIAMLFGGMALIPLLQFAAGQIFFFGDAATASLYLAGLFFAACLGSSLRANQFSLLQPLIWATVFAALASSGLAVWQWLQVGSLGLYAVDIQAGIQSPGANLAQPNQLATLLMLGVVGVHALVELRRISRIAYFAATIFLLMGVALTQSKTGALEVLFYIAWVLAKIKQGEFILARKQVMCLGAIFMAMVIATPIAAESLGIYSKTTEGVRASNSHRWVHLKTAVDALAQEPLSGYGWNQVSVGISRVVTRHEASEEVTERSHNELLDLLLWNGVVLGGLIAASFTLWFTKAAGQAKSVDQTLLIAGLLMLLVHAMLEFPLEYAYFLIPFGLLCGALSAANGKGNSIAVPKPLALLASTPAVAAFLLVSIEYPKLEESNRLLRFEAARVGHDRIESVTPRVKMLTQLRDLQDFSRMDTAHMVADERLDWMRKVAERYPLPQVVLKYGIVAQKNGHAAIAQTALTRICKTVRKPVCDEAHRVWATETQQLPKQ